ncbi:MAG: hypothetical protein IM516_01830 [Pseudanabaena sp. M158S2SP1A06QC]|jgi:hypothetical protein|nr:hypothetical protein [Pseudanabaena sp. M53BS1SP1A06MG]MCA6581328.1 hypothetical protein [Pseudanabaena sp. M34BS1SP1A06MG]MCA6590652.1 hypothetical protein [Pseudanabaena sp. M38BS1SP1A06MG]MCA6600761.1 hypothetical protein [Pseudanabaena sp. M57BS1SP1A06MG]MCA6610854.1 hypothetical protein [Pseudanabaena sp. M158S2SP1A06QC]
MEQFYNQYESEYFQEEVTDITSGSLEKAQQHIYSFFLTIIKHYQVEDILRQFERLFINYGEIDNVEVYNALGEIIFYNKEYEFKNILLRCCYILNNNWALNGNISACQKLVDLFLSHSISLPTKINKLKKLRQWLQNFIQSDEYKTLRSLSGRSGVNKNYHNWSERFSSYLLISEYTDFNKSTEQRQYAGTLARKIKKQFKFDLALYTARIESKTGSASQRQNPTTLGDGVLILIKKILNKRGNEDLRSLAKRFRAQVDDVTFAEFKDYLLDYLGISRNDFEIPEIMRLTVVQKFSRFHEHQNDQFMTVNLFNVACNQVLRYLLLNKRRQPSELLQLSLESNNLLRYVVLLLKVVLICPKSRLYLESYIAELIKFYSSYDEVECRCFIVFLDMLNVTLAIFDKDTDYSLVKMKNLENDFTDISLENYRIFSQSKSLENFISQQLSEQDSTKTLIS